MILRQFLYAALGCLCLVLALIGFVVPILPGFLFLILAIVCFSAASHRVASVVNRHPAASAWQRRWRRGASLPLWQRVQLMFWLTADSAFGKSKQG